MRNIYFLIVILFFFRACQSQSASCSTETDTNGIVGVKCSECGIPTGPGILDIQNALNDLNMNLKLSDLFNPDVSFGINVPIPNGCIEFVGCSPSSISYSVSAEPLLAPLSAIGLDLKDGLTTASVLTSVNWTDTLGNICLESSFEFCSATVRFLVRLHDQALIEYDFSLLDPFFSQNCTVINVDGISIAYDRPTRTLTLYKSISPVFQFGIELILSDILIGRDGFSFCGQALVTPQFLTPLLQVDLGCYSYGTVDVCAQHHDNCTACSETAGCGFCAGWGVCMNTSEKLGPCGLCPTGFSNCDVKAVQANMETQQPITQNYKNLDQNHDYTIPKKEFSKQVGYWLTDSQVSDIYSQIDTNKDNVISYNEYQTYQKTKQPSKLSGGAIAAIVICTLIGVAGIAVGVFFAVKKGWIQKLIKH